MPKWTDWLKRSKPSEDEKQEVARIGGLLVGTSAHFIWSAEEGIQSIAGSQWLKTRGIPYLEWAYALYRDRIIGAGEPRKLPARVIIGASSKCAGGVSGGTSNGELSFCAGKWDSNASCYGILAHELCNLFTGEVISAGWPVEWWANHRSPFPTVAANRVMRVLVPQFSKGWGDFSDPLVVMFDRFFREYPEMFPKMFRKMKEFGVSLSGLNDPYLSHVLYYFMFYGAGLRLNSFFVSPPMPQFDEGMLNMVEERYKLGVTSLSYEG